MYIFIFCTFQFVQKGSMVHTVVRCVTVRMEQNVTQPPDNVYVNQDMWATLVNKVNVKVYL